ncbi:MAG: hypothetical protein DRJ65_05625 [Acidobacteria bacterium]|nr:MAG: hypothetical protein DRJ65_05625 [Acidobacteriota bacterium]
MTTNARSPLSFGLLMAFIIGWYWMPSTSAQASGYHNLLFYVLVMPGLWVLCISRTGKSLDFSPLILASGAFITYLWATSFWAQGAIERPPETVTLHALATATFILGVYQAFDRSRLSLFRRIVVIAATSITLVSIVAWLFGRTYHLGQLHSAIHFEHPNLFAQALGFAALLALGSAFRSRTHVSRIVYTTAFFLLAFGIFLTRGRAVILATVVAGLISIAVHRGRRTIAVALIVVIVIFGIFLTSQSTYVDLVERGDAGRTHIWKTLLKRMADRPVIGAGINADDNVVFPKGSWEFPNGFKLQHPHSAVVGTLYYGGLIALGLLFLVMALALWAGRRNARVDGEWDPLILLLFGIICLIPDGHRLISEPHLSSWLLFWLPIGLIATGPFTADGVTVVESTEPDHNSLDDATQRSHTSLGGAVVMLLILAALLLRAPHMGEMIDGPHTWRQCDTAQYIHAFYTDGIDLLHPSVCWMGDHRTLILEFPLPEAISAVAYGLFGPSHITARWVTLLFFIGSTVFFFLFVRSITDRETARLAVVISMIVPLALFYSRAIHIDYPALFFAHAMAWLWVEAIKRNSGTWLWMGSIPAALALIIKAPYVLPFVPFLIWMTFSRSRWKLVLRHAPAFILPALVLAAWQWHAMTVNGAAPDWFFIPTYRRFTNNFHWWFGTLFMRQNPAHWLALGQRVLFEITGWFGLVLALVGLWVTAAKHRQNLLWWIAGAGLGVVIFFNLNVMHNYYQLPLVGPISVLIALGILHITGLMKAGPALRHTVALALVLVVGAESVRWSTQHYFEVLEPLRTAGLAIGNVVPEGQLVVVSAGGLDPRSPHLLYRARRYGWSIPDRDLKPDLVERLEKEGAAWLAVVAPEPPTGPLELWLRELPTQVLNLPGGQVRLFVYHLADRPPPLFEVGFEEGNLGGWYEGR